MAKVGQRRELDSSSFAVEDRGTHQYNKTTFIFLNRDALPCGIIHCKYVRSLSSLPLV